MENVIKFPVREGIQNQEIAKKNFEADIKDLLENDSKLAELIEEAKTEDGKQPYASGLVRDLVLEKLLSRHQYRPPLQRMDPEGFEELERIRKELYIAILNSRRGSQAESIDRI